MTPPPELERAADHYDGESRGLGLRFITAVQRVVALVRRYPGLGAPVHREYRRVLVNRFPYSVIYREHDEFVRIVAVVSHALDPVDWIGR